MALTVSCRCGKTFTAPAHLAGKSVKCPACSSPLHIPQAAGEGRLRVSCSCGKNFNAPREMANKIAVCPACGSQLTIPYPADASTSTPARPAAPEASSGSHANPAAGGVAAASLAPSTRGAGSRTRWMIMAVAICSVLVTSLVVLTVTIGLRPEEQRPTSAQGGNPPHTSAPELDWITFDFPNDGYAVALPTAPQHQTKSVAGGNISMVVADVGRAGSYNVAVHRLPEAALPGYDPQAALQSGMERAIASSQGRLIVQKAIELDDHPGREFSFSGSHGELRFTAHSRIYAVGPAVYQLLFIGPNGQHSPAELAKFFESFHLTGTH